MSSLLVSQPLLFLGKNLPFAEASYVVVGVPLDYTSTYRSGSRFAPNAIREASLNIESYSMRVGIDAEDLPISDIGNIHITQEAKENIERISCVISEITSSRKIPVILGGEHTITLGAVKGFKKRNFAVINFDAHLDLRDEYLGNRISHSTVMRRLFEEGVQVIQVGSRAVCKEEVEFAREKSIEILTSHDIRSIERKGISDKLLSSLSSYDSVYISLDLDVLDPAYAPAVANPEPEGLSVSDLLGIIRDIISEKTVVGLDVVELAPQYDFGNTPIVAAKIICEVLCFIEKLRKEI